MIIQQQSWRLNIKNKGAPANNCILELYKETICKNWQTHGKTPNQTAMQCSAKQGRHKTRNFIYQVLCCNSRKICIFLLRTIRVQCLSTKSMNGKVIKTHLIVITILNNTHTRLSFIHHMITLQGFPVDSETPQLLTPDGSNMTPLATSVLTISTL